MRAARNLRDLLQENLRNYSYMNDYYEEQKREVEAEIKRTSDRLINEFIRIFNEAHSELNRLHVKVETIQRKAEESEKQEKVKVQDLPISKKK